MSIQILGMVATQNGSESLGWANTKVVDPAFLRAFARAHDDAGFDRTLIGYSAASPDGFAIASDILATTERLGVLIAHRPGFTEPVLVARKLATLENLYGEGRVAIHHISGGSDTDQQREGDFSDKPARYRRTAEFIDVLRRTLSSAEPFDHEGEFYKYVGAFSAVKPNGQIPIFFGGQSGDAVAIGAEHTDTFMLFGEPLAPTAERIALIRAEAAKHGRNVEFSVSLRPIVADTEDAAWEKAAAIYDAAAERLGNHQAGWRFGRRQGDQTSTSAQRLQDAAAESEVHDERLWTGITKLVGPAGNSTAPVGTPAQVAEAILKYYDLGVTRVLIRGFDPLNDVRRWGEELVPLLRSGADARDAAASDVPGEPALVGAGGTV
ncbi:LLM class flavin-dependent oxidoreductase [Occultella glacieicola]|uniref:LLM class flavin-dependent oxidoreductase n=1 Tax=Occultella glacieicola TaxID=2518684 RepID=A0ABY2E6V4_9MICO|nr:LLM class flavin-dependent oxidoreductase [Occultella glacieicola]TDE97280.1 LLM class flavin-dependent oxidoreductase [Occultella glacieicola]